MIELIHMLGENYKKHSGNTSMLLRFDGGAPKDMVDKNRVFQSFGTNVRYDAVTKKFGTHSLYVGPSSRLQVPDSPELRHGSRDFTIEMHALHASIATNTCLFAKSNSNLRSGFATWTDSGDVMGITNDSGIITRNNMILIPTAQWVHWALQRRNGAFSLYRNGQPIFNQFNFAGTFGENNSPFSIGGFSYHSSSSSSCNSYFDELRVSNIARYTGSFTPPAQRFVLD